LELDMDLKKEIYWLEYIWIWIWNWFMHIYGFKFVSILKVEWNGIE
jgi:hypothetical protein